MDVTEQKPNPQVALEKYFGLESFREGQKETITSVLEGGDTIAVMPTGRGKSLCYQLPAVCQEGIVLVISPLISLMRDQVMALKEKGLPAGCIHSGMTAVERRDTFAEIKENSSYILYLSPERVQKEGFSDWIANANLSLIAIDEAHCVSQWGPDFRKDYYKLDILRELKPETAILATTATATPQVIEDISKQLGLRKPTKHIYGFYRPNLYYQVEFCESEDVKVELLRVAIRNTPEGRVLVYAGTRKKCEELCQMLRSEFRDVGFYHAGLSADDRDEVQDRYEAGLTRILFATNAFGMGVDHPDVRLVVHYQMTGNIDAYYQEMGRAGRDGQESTCLLLYAKKDKGLQAFFIQQSKAPPWVVQSKWRMLDAMLLYAEGGECRHAGILEYFRDGQRIESCSHCDSCVPESSRKIPRPDFIPTLKAKDKKIRRKKIKRKKRKRSKSENITLAPEETERAKRIKVWRLKYARSQNIPAFLVFSNKTVDDLARKNPQTLFTLEEVYGIGSFKAQRFGGRLIEVLQEENA